MNQRQILCYGTTVFVILAIIYLIWTTSQAPQPYVAEGITSTTTVTPVPVTDPIPTPAPAPPPPAPVPSILTFPIASKNLNGYNYVGCWKDTGSPRALTTKLADNQTMASCINLAKSKGFDTAALQASSHTCWGGNQGVNGNNYHMYDQKQDSDPTCNINTPGSWTNVTYSTTPVPVMAPAPTPAPAPVPTPVPSHTPPPSDINGYPFAGCWNIDPSSNQWQKMTGPANWETCISMAKSGKYSDVAFRKPTDGSAPSCWAGNGGMFQKPGAISVNDSKCSLENPGEGTNVIYSTVPPQDPASQDPYFGGYTYRGCYNNKPGQTPPLPTYAGKLYSIDCARYAMGYGYKTFGITNVNDCYVGNLNATTLVDNYKDAGLFDTKAAPYACNIQGVSPDSMVIYSILDESATPTPTPPPVTDTTTSVTPTPTTPPVTDTTTSVTPTPTTPPVTDTTTSVTPTPTTPPVTDTTTTAPTPSPSPSPSPTPSPSPMPAPYPTPPPPSGNKPLPSASSSSSWFSPRSYIQSQSSATSGTTMSNGSYPSLPTTFTRNVQNSQSSQPQPVQQTQPISTLPPNFTTISFEPSAASTTTITFSQIPYDDSAAATSNTSKDKEPVVADSSTYYPYQSVLTTQPTAQQLMPYITDMKPKNRDPSKTPPPLISSGAGSSYYFSSTPQQVSTNE
jgi:hypothetical protein